MTVTSLLFPLVLSCMMSFLISGITTLKAVGFIEHFFAMWMSAWIVAWMFAFLAYWSAHRLHKGW